MIKRPSYSQVEGAWRIIAITSLFDLDRKPTLKTILRRLEAVDDEGDSFHLFDALLDLAFEHDIKAEDFFRLTKSNAWDRSSAYSAWCAHKKWPDVELSTHDLTDDEHSYLERRFKGRVPPSLIAEDWST